jgi:myxalamid-type polyketide synthase MxaE and MxaD
MVGQGARHLVLVGRSAPSAAAQAAIDAMTHNGASVVAAQADVARQHELARVLDGIERSMPPLRGVIHAAAVLDDGILLQLDEQRFATVMAPKIEGAWNLHTLTLSKPLDHFVLFSSAASILGSPGQGNYAAANAYLDALAHHRRALGRPALSINWGPWADVGQAARPGRGGRLELRGIASLSPSQGLEALAHLMRHGATQAAVVRLDVRQWRQFYPKAAESPLLAGLLEEQGPCGEMKKSETALRAALLAAEAGWRRRALLEAHLQEQIGQVLRMAPSRIDRETPLTKMGLDSLMALELRNRLEASLGLTLSATLIWGYPTIAALASHLATKMEIPLGAAAEVTTEAEDVAQVADLSAEETRALLTAELDDLPEELLHGD